MTLDESDDIWALYAKGVRKLGEKPSEEKTRPERQPSKMDRLAPSRIEKQDNETPAAWLEAIKEDHEKLPTSPLTREIEPTKAAEPASPGAASSRQPRRREPLDLRVERNLSLGDVVVEARLDLHGKTEESAHEALLSFVEKQQGLGRRLVLVITGKGKDKASPLRQNLPRWCDAPPLYDKINAVREAASHHGGEGAYYVLLRKKNA